MKKLVEQYPALMFSLKDFETAETTYKFLSSLVRSLREYQIEVARIVNFNAYSPLVLWTPVLTFATPGNLSVAYSLQYGHYVDLGNLVLVDFEIVTSTFTHTTASGALRITGLPFTVGANGAARMPVQWGGITKAGYTNILAIGVNATTRLQLQGSGSGVAAADVVAADMPTGGSVTLRGTGIYHK